MKNLTIYILTLCLMFATIGVLQAQTTQKRSIELSGQLFDRETMRPATFVNILIKGTKVGTISDMDGNFTLLIYNTDTLLLSSVQFELEVLSFAYVTSSKHFIQRFLNPRVYSLDEVEVEGIGNYERLKQEIIDREHRRKYPQREFVEKEPVYNTKRPDYVKPTIVNPFDYLYELWGKRPKELRELEKLETQEAYEQLLAFRFSPHVVGQLTGLTEPKLKQFMDRCRFSREFVFHASDYEFYMAILDYYRAFQAEMNGDYIPYPNNKW